MAVNVQTTPEHRNRVPPGWDKILWAPKKKFTRKPIRFHDLINGNIEDDQQTPPNCNEQSSSRSPTTPTFNEKPAYKPVILKFDDDDDE